jgi:glycosyltransferase involved in cell wall biosynthesis
MPITKKLQPTPGKQRKIRLLAYGDSPAIPSGFGSVMRNIFQRLGRSGRYDIDIIGINDRGNYKDPMIHPYHLHQARPPGEADFHGRGNFINIVRGGGIDLTPPWDIIFLLNDPFILEEPIPFFRLGVLPALKDIQKTHYTKLPPDMWFRTIGYFPIDSPVKPVWVEHALSLVDTPVAYTDYGRQQILSANDQLDHPAAIDPVVIPHGTDTEVFKPLVSSVVSQFRRDFFAGGLRSDTFLVIGVGRNSARKDLVRTMQIFKEFQRRRPDSFLYLHAQAQGTWGSLEEAGLQLGLRQGKDWNYPKDFTEHKGFPDEILNGIYNAADVLLSTTQGEGWGLPLTEAMTTKTLVMAPNHTALSEILNTTAITPGTSLPQLLRQPVRGIPLAAGTTKSEWVNHGATDLERFRPLTNIDAAVQKLLWVYDHPERVRPIINRAYRWAKNLTWDSVVAQWEHLINTQFKLLETERHHPSETSQIWQSYRLPKSTQPTR